MGSKQKVIAQALGIAQETVSTVLKRNRETGVPTHRARQGRPRRTTEKRRSLSGTFVPIWACQVSKHPSC